MSSVWLIIKHKYATIKQELNVSICAVKIP